MQEIVRHHYERSLKKRDNPEDSYSYVNTKEGGRMKSVKVSGNSQLKTIEEASLNGSNSRTASQK